jgi:uncharacterized delta-60 repeat protein
MKTITLTLTLLFVFTTKSFSQPGSLDSSFGKNGKAVNMSVGGSSVAIQPDGKILVTGTYNDFSVQRFRNNGKIDKSFGDNGTASTTFEEFGYGLHASLVAVQPGGKIIVAGSVWNGDYFETHLCLARFKNNGLPDSSFGTNGRVQAVIGQDGNEDVSDLIIKPDGKILVTIWQYMNFHQGRTAAMQFNTDGSVDTYFEVDASVHDLSYAASMQSDGKLVVTGSLYKDPFGDQFALFRFTQTGWVDTTFGKSGTATIGRHAAGMALAVQADDKIVALTQDSLLARFKKDGVADSSFNTKGRISIPFKGYALSIQANGKIIVAGSMYNGINNDFVLARYKANGKPDKTFGVNGIATTDLGASEGVADVAIQTDGNILASGSGDLLRYKGDPTSIVSADNVSDIDKASNQSVSINLYPNPFRSTLNIDVKSIGKTRKTISVYDMRGSLLYTTSTVESTRLNLRSLVYGSYFVKITDENGKELYNGKVIKN